MSAVTDIVADDPTKEVTVAEAALALRVTPKTLRQWIRKDGAPCVYLGGPGPGKGTKVNVADVQAWQARRAGVDDGTALFLEKVAIALLDTHRCEWHDTGRIAHVALGMHPGQSAGHLIAVYSRIHRNLTGRALDENVPDAIEQLATIFGVSKPNQKVRIR